MNKYRFEKPLKTSYGNQNRFMVPGPDLTMLMVSLVQCSYVNSLIIGSIELSETNNGLRSSA